MMHPDNQMPLFDNLPLNFSMPAVGSYPHQVLMRLLKGERITQQKFGFDSWRLAAHIAVLKNVCGFPIVSLPVANPYGGREIAEYSIAAEDIAAIRAQMASLGYGE